MIKPDDIGLKPRLVAAAHALGWPDATEEDVLYDNMYTFTWRFIRLPVGDDGWTVMMEFNKHGLAVIAYRRPNELVDATWLTADQQQVTYGHPNTREFAERLIAQMQ